MRIEGGGLDGVRNGGVLPAGHDIAAGRAARPTGDADDDPHTPRAEPAPAARADRNGVFEQPREQPAPSRRGEVSPTGAHRRTRSPRLRWPWAPRSAVDVAVAAAIVVGLILVGYLGYFGYPSSRRHTVHWVAGSDGDRSPLWTPLPTAAPSTPATPVRSVRPVVEHTRATDGYEHTGTRPRPIPPVPTVPSTVPHPDRPSGFVSIVDRIDKCMDVAGSGTGDGVAVQQWSCTGHDNQLWALEPSDVGYYLIINRNSRECMDVYHDDHGDGARVHQWSCNGGHSQQWHPHARAPGYYRLVNRNSGKCLDVYNFDRSDGARVVQWSCNGKANQDFTFPLSL